MSRENRLDSSFNSRFRYRTHHVPEEHAEEEPYSEDLTDRMREITTYCVSCLPPWLQPLYTLHYEKGLTHRQIASSVGLSLGASHGHVKRMKHLLSACIENNRHRLYE